MKTQKKALQLFPFLLISASFGTILALPMAPNDTDILSASTGIELDQNNATYVSNLTDSFNGTESSNGTVLPKQSRQGRIMNFKFPEVTDDSNNITESSETAKSDGPAGVPGLSKSGQSFKPAVYSSSGSVSYSNPTDISGSDLIPYFYDHHQKPGGYHLLPKKPSSTSFSFHDAIKDTLFRFKDSVTHGVTKFKNAIGFGNGFSEKISSPDAIMAVAPVAAGLLAGGLAVAFLASKAGGARSNGTKPFHIFGKRSIRDILSEEGMNVIVSRLDPVQREYLQKMQLYGPQRWKDTSCAKFILCDVMRKASPLHIFDMQRKVGVFLSRMDEGTARYVEMILKDVMLGIQARDCSRFSCAHAPWGLPPQSPPVPIFPQQQLPPHFQPFNGHNFLRRRQ